MDSQIEEISKRRALLNDQIKAETLEKTKLEAEKTKLEAAKTEIEEKLFSVESSLEKKLIARTEYDKVIGDAEKVCCKSLHLTFCFFNVYI